MSAGLDAALEARRAARARAEVALAHALRARERAERALDDARAALAALPAAALEPPRAQEVSATPASGAALSRAGARARMQGETRARLRLSASAAQRALQACAAEVEQRRAALTETLALERALERAARERADAEQRLRERREQAASDEAVGSRRQRSARPAPAR